jgi:hypothetical protein
MAWLFEGIMVKEMMKKATAPERGLQGVRHDNASPLSAVDREAQVNRLEGEIDTLERTEEAIVTTCLESASG